MLSAVLSVTFVVLSLLPVPTTSSHLSFILNGFECFYEDVAVENTKCYMDIASISESEKDRLSHVYIYGPDHQEIKAFTDIDYEHYEFTANETGAYKVCVGNVYDFTVGESLVYLGFYVGGREDDWTGFNKHSKALTLMESTLASIHENMNIAENFQKRDRHQFAKGLFMAMKLNQEVMWWSCGQAAIIVSAGILQVFLLRRFFTVTKQEL